MSACLSTLPLLDCALSHIRGPSSSFPNGPLETRVASSHQASSRCVGAGLERHCPFRAREASPQFQAPPPLRWALFPPRPWPLPRIPRGTPLHPALPSTRRPGPSGHPCPLTAPCSRMGTSCLPTAHAVCPSTHCCCVCSSPQPSGPAPCGSDPLRPGRGCRRRAPSRMWLQPKHGLPGGSQPDSTHPWQPGVRVWCWAH